MQSTGQCFGGGGECICKLKLDGELLTKSVFHPNSDPNCERSAAGDQRPLDDLIMPSPIVAKA